MARAGTIFACNECGGQSPKWQGQCPSCGAWNSLIETVAERPAAHRYSSSARAAPLTLLARIAAREAPRMPTGVAELDRALGGGLIAGQVALIGGDPGIGKSTLLLQSLAWMSAARKAIYVTGEESTEQVALRAQRLQVESAAVQLLAEIQLERISATLAAERPEIAVIDSIQTLYSEALSSAPGSVAQVRECAAQLTRLAKEQRIALIFVGHVTKEGALAGPRVLEHIVDTVLYFEGDPHSSFRLIRAFKNRFGPVNELGVFAMTERGLRGVDNPSALFLSHHRETVPGSSILVTNEGTRPLLVEVQALVDRAHGLAPRRLAQGLDQNRLGMLLAVLHRHARLAVHDHDVFVNAVGGVRIAEPAADLAVLLAIVSSFRDQTLPAKLVVFGEVGLGGEVRPAPRGQERLREAAKLGFQRAFVPKANAPKRGRAVDGIEVVPIERLTDAVRELFRENA
jgi:DNA repair protein RadA/Sms